MELKKADKSELSAVTGTKGYFYLFILLFLLSGAGVLQAKAPLLSDMQKKYPDNDAVYLKKTIDVHISIKDNKPAIGVDHYQEMLMLNDNASLYANKSVYYSSFHQITDLKAKTLVPGKFFKYKTYKVRNISNNTDVSGFVFYGGDQYKKFIFPAVQKGAETVLSYHENILDPHLTDAYFFNSFVPIDHIKITVTFPKSVDVRYKLFNARGRNIQFTKQETGDEITYTWSASQVKKYEVEDRSPNIAYYAPHVLIYIASYKVNGKTVELLDGPKGLYNWDYSLLKDVNKKPDKALKTFVDSITRGAKSEHEKVKRIYYWVQDNIKYIAFEDSLGGFVPRPAAKVFEKRYGDCKDMADLLSYMLQLAHIHGYRTWIGTRDIPYTYEDVPTPMCDNHMICTYIDKAGRHYYLDATAEYIPFGIPTSMIQGKEALIGKGKDGYEIATVPVVPMDSNLTADSTFITLTDNGDVTGRGVLNIKGYNKINKTSDMLNISSDHDMHNYLKSLLTLGNNKFKLDTATYKNLKNHSGSMTINYKFEIPDYAVKNNNEIYLNLNLYKMLQDDVIDTAQRKLSIQNDYKSVDVETSILDVPEGYHIEYLPKNVSFKSDLFGFNIKYIQQGNRVYADCKIDQNYLILHKSSFDEWNKMIKKLSAAYDESIILKKDNS